jgi:peptidylprolyl isomerase
MCRLTPVSFALAIVVLIPVSGPASALQATQPTAARTVVPQAPPAPPDVAAPPDDAEKLESGLATRLLQAGTGERKAGPTDLVTFNYTAWRAADGRAFDSTVVRGKPSKLLMDRLMAGLAQGLQMMVAGEKRRLWVPEALAFKGQAGRPQGTIVFDVELLAIEPSPAEPPPDVMAPPDGATRTSSGLAYRVLSSGAGGRRPGASDRVTVHYSGWTTDGKLFDSSVLRGEAATFGLDQVIKGWTEGVQLMSVGDKWRFWIPSRLAYNNQAGMPRGMLVFDIELLGIEK